MCPTFDSYVYALSTVRCALCTHCRMNTTSHHTELTPQVVEGRPQQHNPLTSSIKCKIAKVYRNAAKSIHLMIVCCLLELSFPTKQKLLSTQLHGIQPLLIPQDKGTQLYVTN